ncbi:MAG: YbjN domain-containing protein [Nitriliruptoraceae bacterium]
MSPSPGFDFLVTSLREAGLDIAEHPEHATVSFEHAGETGRWIVFCRSQDPLPQVLVYSQFPRQVPEDRRATMMALITRINYGLAIGNLEMDLDDGDLRLRTSLDFGEDRLTGALLARLLGHNLATFDRYFPALDAVLLGGDDPQVLLEMVADRPG